MPDDSSLIYCDTYSCRLLPEACAARYRMAQTPYESARGRTAKYLSGDPGCVNCAAGKARAVGAGAGTKGENMEPVDKNIDVSAVIAGACGQFGVSVGNVMEKKIRGGKFSAARKEIFSRLKCAGMTNREISRILGISTNAIDQWAYKGKKTPRAKSQKQPSPPPLPLPDEPAPYPQIDVVWSGGRPAEANRRLICLDFTEFTGIYDRIFEIARDEMRSPENQILYWLRGYLKDTA